MILYLSLPTSPFPANQDGRTSVANDDTPRGSRNDAPLHVGNISAGLPRSVTSFSERDLNAARHMMSPDELRSVTGTTAANALRNARAPGVVWYREMNTPKLVGSCATATLVALYIVGAVSNGVLRHIVQTLPLWFPIVMALRRREVAKWASLPCFAIWLVLMSLIWLFLLGWARVISGHFTPIEVVLTFVIGGASLVGLVIGTRWRTNLSWRKGLAVATVFAVLQLAALRISFLPSIATDR